MASGRYSQEKGNRFENRVIKALWSILKRPWPWGKYEKPDEGFHPPPELSGWRFECRARQRPGVYEALEKAQREADDPAQVALIFSKSGSQNAFENHRVYVAVPWKMWSYMLRAWYERKKSLDDLLRDMADKEKP